MFGEERENSAGLDVEDLNALLPIKKAMEAWFDINQKNLEKNPTNDQFAITNPANLDEIIGYNKTNNKQHKK